MLRKSLNFLYDQHYNHGKIFDKNWKDIKNTIIPVKFSSHHFISYSSKKKKKKLTFLHLEMFCSFSPLFFLLLSLTLETLEVVKVIDVGVCWNAVYNSTGTSSPLSVALVSPSSRQNKNYYMCDTSISNNKTAFHIGTIIYPSFFSLPHVPHSY